MKQLLVCLALLSLCAITVCVSAHFKSLFHAVSVSCMIWLAPLLIRIMGGGAGYIDFSGNLDICIAIRLAYAKKGRVYVRSGAGIVADSVPEKEYEECINNAQAVINALKMAEEEDL